METINNKDTSADIRTNSKTMSQIDERSVIREGRITGNNRWSSVMLSRKYTVLLCSCRHKMEGGLLLCIAFVIGSPGVSSGFWELYPIIEFLHISGNGVYTLTIMCSCNNVIMAKNGWE